MLLFLKLCVGLPKARFIELCFCSSGCTSVEVSNWFCASEPSTVVERLPRSNYDELLILLAASSDFVCGPLTGCDCLMAVGRESVERMLSSLRAEDWPGRHF